MNQERAAFLSTIHPFSTWTRPELRAMVILIAPSIPSFVGPSIVPLFMLRACLVAFYICAIWFQLSCRVQLTELWRWTPNPNHNSSHTPIGSRPEGTPRALQLAHNSSGAVSLEVTLDHANIRFSLFVVCRFLWIPPCPILSLLSAFSKFSATFPSVSVLKSYLSLSFVSSLGRVTYPTIFSSSWRVLFVSSSRSIDRLTHLQLRDQFWTSRKQETHKPVTWHLRLKYLHDLL